MMTKFSGLVLALLLVSFLVSTTSYASEFTFNHYGEDMPRSHTRDLRDNLKSWSSAHRAKLIDLLEKENISEGIRQHLKGVFSRNTYMFELDIREPNTTMDDSWASYMKALITRQIIHHPENKSLKILSVECKQLLCDIFLVDHNKVDSAQWLKIHKTLAATLPSAAPVGIVKMPEQRHSNTHFSNLRKAHYVYAYFNFFNNYQVLKEQGLLE